MLILRKIAVTGNVACGKSTVCQFLREEGAFVVSADEIIHNLLQPNTSLGKKVILLLGNDIVEKGIFSKEKIANKVFNNPELLQQLENLLHPPTLLQIEHAYEQAKKNDSSPLFVVEFPLLMEIKKEDLFDTVILVDCKESLAKERWQKRKKSLSDFWRRTKRLLPNKEKREKAEFILENNHDLKALKAEVKKLYKQLT